MGLSGDLTGYENLEILSPYPIQQLTELKITRRINCHTKVYYSGIIPEEQQDHYIRTASCKDSLVINQKSAGKTRPLFKGRVSAIGVKAVQGVYYLEVEGHSATKELDYKLKDRSFQDHTKKVTELLNQIISAYPGGSIKDQACQGAAVGTLVVQSNETDWQLLMRLASRFNAFLIPDDLADKPKVYFGLPNPATGATVFSDELPYRIGKNLSEYAELSENYLQGMTATDFTYFIVETGQYYPLGTPVKFKGVKLIISQSTAVLKNSTLIYEYQLCPADGLKQKPIYNRKIAGMSLKGKVIDISRDKVRVHLDIDKQQDKDTAWWFPYSSFYTAEGNSGFYCMPQIGDQLLIYFPTVHEEDAVAINSVRKDAEGCSKTQDPSVKYLGTNHGKELMLSEGELSLTAKNRKDGQILIKLNDDHGVEIRSDNELYLTARKNIIFDLEQTATIKAKEEVQLVCGESSINLDGITHLKGVAVSLKPRK
ncbi:MAG TPA: phage baseplate assembly protein V [Bacillota bacterium]